VFKCQTLTFHFSTYRPNPFKRLSHHTCSDCMRESTAAIVASVVETTPDHVLPHQQHFLDQKQTFNTKHCIPCLVKHLSPYTGCISDWMGFAPSPFAYRKQI